MPAKLGGDDLRYRIATSAVSESGSRPSTPTEETAQPAPADMKYTKPLPLNAADPAMSRRTTRTSCDTTSAVGRATDDRRRPTWDVKDHPPTLTRNGQDQAGLLGPARQINPADSTGSEVYDHDRSFRVRESPVTPPVLLWPLGGY